MSAFDYQGYEILSGLLPGHAVQKLRDDLSGLTLGKHKGGLRNAEKKFPLIHELAQAPELRRLAESYLTGIASVVRVILFDKTPDNNWRVSWHQDQTVTLSDKVELEDWGPWSQKDGVYHVQPPIEVLDNMVSLRLHLDPADRDNGCLRVIPSSHNAGLLDAEQIQQYAESHPAEDCVAQTGDVLVMRPHLLHRSCKASHPKARRIIHIEYSGYQLPSGLSWA